MSTNPSLPHLPSRIARPQIEPDAVTGLRAVIRLDASGLPIEPATPYRAVDRFGPVTPRPISPLRAALGLPCPSKTPEAL
jgi:hypothetical protein